MLVPADGSLVHLHALADCTTRVNASASYEGMASLEETGDTCNMTRSPLTGAQA
jgi:hypothetical protein